MEERERERQKKSDKSGMDDDKWKKRRERERERQKKSDKSGMDDDKWKKGEEGENEYEEDESAEESESESDFDALLSRIDLSDGERERGLEEEQESMTEKQCERGVREEEEGRKERLTSVKGRENVTKNEREKEGVSGKSEAGTEANAGQSSVTGHENSNSIRIQAMVHTSGGEHDNSTKQPDSIWDIQRSGSHTDTTCTAGKEVEAQKITTPRPRQEGYTNTGKEHEAASSKHKGTSKGMEDRHKKDNKTPTLGNKSTNTRQFTLEETMQAQSIIDSDNEEGNKTNGGGKTKTKSHTTGKQQ